MSWRLTWPAAAAAPGATIPPSPHAPAVRRFIVVTGAADAESPSRLDVVMNWVEDLKRRAPRQPAR